MKKIAALAIAIIVIITSSLACTIEDDNPVTCEEMLQDLEGLRASIVDFAETSICNEEFECRYIAFGSKPCGGPWEYLVYTTSIDTLELEALVNDFNEQQANYNQVCGIVSDCSVPNEPVGFTCEDNQCIPIF